MKNLTGRVSLISFVLTMVFYSLNMFNTSAFFGIVFMISFCVWLLFCLKSWLKRQDERHKGYIEEKKKQKKAKVLQEAMKNIDIDDLTKEE